VIAKIGRMPPTLHSRSIRIEASAQDREVKKKRKAKESDESNFLTDPDPWPDPVEGDCSLGYSKQSAIRR
jgi:hypothetical protein